MRPRQHAQTDPNAVTQTQWNANQYGQPEQKRTLDWHNQAQDWEKKNQFKNRGKVNCSFSFYNNSKYTVPPPFFFDALP